MGYIGLNLDISTLERELRHRDSLITRQDESIRDLTAERDALKAERDAFALILARQVAA